LLAVLGAPGTAPALLLLLPVYLAAMFWVVRRLLERAADGLAQQGRLSDSGLAMSVASAWSSGGTD
jgi:hypothetical protein